MSFELVSKKPVLQGIRTGYLGKRDMNSVRDLAGQIIELVPGALVLDGVYTRTDLISIAPWRIRLRLATKGERWRVVLSALPKIVLQPWPKVFVIFKAMFKFYLGRSEELEPEAGTVIYWDRDRQEERT